MSKGTQHPPLNKRGRLFCEAWVETGCRWKAAFGAGYRKKRVAALDGAEPSQELKDALTRDGCRMLRDPRVVAYVAQLREQQTQARQEQRARELDQQAQARRPMTMQERWDHYVGGPRKAMEALRAMHSPVKSLLPGYGSSTYLRMPY